MEFQLSPAVEILERTPQVLAALLDGLSEPWVEGNEGPQTWSPRDVLGHFIHGEETDWIPRARIILAHGASQPFEPFDRFAQFQKFAGWPMDRLLKRFSELRRENVRILQSWELSAEDLSLPGTHPELGPVTLGQLLAAWVVHDFNHLRQIAEVMARQYSDEVGVWWEYMPVLHPANN